MVIHFKFKFTYLKKCLEIYKRFREKNFIYYYRLSNNIFFKLIIIIIITVLDKMYKTHIE